MDEQRIAEIRALICSAMDDIGGACERLCELEELAQDGRPGAPMTEEMAEDVSTWLSQAGDRLCEAALVSDGVLQKEGGVR